jgi:DNA polymerase-3 subunit delta
MGSPEIKPAYLIAGGDEAKIAAAIGRLRARAEREGGVAALESFDPPDGKGAPDAEALIGALSAMSLLGSRRYLLADHVDRWTKKQAETVAERLAGADPETTVVLVAHGSAPKPLLDAVRKLGGDLLSYEAPKARALPGWIAEEARSRGIELDRDAARLLVERMGESTARLATELDRLALWAAEDRRVSAADLAAMVADTSEEMTWTLSDAVVERRAGDALATAERLMEQGASVAHLVYVLAGRLRKAVTALAQLEAGRPAKQVESSLGMNPYAAKMLIRSIRDARPEELSAAICVTADLEWFSRGGSEYSDATALALSVRAATGGD